MIDLMPGDASLHLLLGKKRGVLTWIKAGAIAEAVGAELTFTDSVGTKYRLRIVATSAPKKSAWTKRRAQGQPRRVVEVLEETPRAKTP